MVDSVLAQDIPAVYPHDTCPQTTERSNTIAPANTKHCCIDMGGSRLESVVGVCDSAFCIVAEMGLYVAINSFVEGSRPT